MISINLLIGVGIITEVFFFVIYWFLYPHLKNNKVEEEG